MSAWYSGEQCWRCSRRFAVALVQLLALAVNDAQRVSWADKTTQIYLTESIVLLPCMYTQVNMNTSG